MKKFFASLGLFFSSFVVNVWISYSLLSLSLLLLILFFPVAIFINIFVITLVVTGTILIMKFCKKYFKISAPLFISLTQIPTIFLGILFSFIIKFNPDLLVASNLTPIDIETNYVISLITPIYTTVVLFFTVLVCLIIHSRKKHKMNTPQYQYNIPYNNNFNNNFNNNPNNNYMYNNNFNNNNLYNNNPNNNNFNNSFNNNNMYNNPNNT